MRRVCACVLVVASCVTASATLTGCGRQAGSAPVAPNSPRERSVFYTQLSDPKSSTLKSRFEEKFPAHNFQVAVGQLTVTSPEGQVSHQVEIYVAAKDVTPAWYADRPLILNECEGVLRELLSSSGMELNGAVHETMQDDKKDGFWFYYKSPNKSGSVRVHPDGGGNLAIVVREQE